MRTARKIVMSEHQREQPVAIVGGDHAYLDVWPVNPDGEPMLLVMTVFCERLADCTGMLKAGRHPVIHMFSTYSRSEYFLDQIVYDPSDVQSAHVTSGYTRMLVGDLSKSVNSDVPCIPRRTVTVEPVCLDEDAHPMFSFFAETRPRPIAACQRVAEGYGFLCQLYSSDFPEPFKDVFYLTDAIGYVLLRTDSPADGEDAGAFFVLAS